MNSTVAEGQTRFGWTYRYYGKKTTVLVLYHSLSHSKIRITLRFIWVMAWCLFLHKSHHCAPFSSSVSCVFLLRCLSLRLQCMQIQHNVMWTPSRRSQHRKTLNPVQTAVTQTQQEELQEDVHQLGLFPVVVTRWGNLWRRKDMAHKCCSFKYKMTLPFSNDALSFSVGEIHTGLMIYVISPFIDRPSN